MTQLVRWGEDMRDNNYYVYFYKALLINIAFISFADFPLVKWWSSM